MKGHRFTLLLVLVLATSSAAGGALAGAAADASTTRTAKATLTVHVVDNFNNDIQGATVTASWDGGQTDGTTLPNGEAGLAVPKNTPIAITIQHASYLRNNPINVTVEQDERTVEITVSRKATAEVKVTENGVPLSNAQVVMYKENRSQVAARGTTDGDGIFASPTIEKGTYRIVAFKAGYSRNQTWVDVRDTTETTIAIEEGTVTVDFAVKDDHFDPARPIEGATIQIEGVTSASLETGGSGSRSIGLPVNAQYTITVTKDGYTTAKRTVSVGEDSKTLTFTLNREPALNLEAVNQKVVVGEKVQLSVTDEYGESVPNANVFVDGTKLGTTDAEGVYRATIDSAGSHTIIAKKSGVTSREVTVEGVSTGSDATPTPTGGDSQTASPTGTATGTATATESQLPDFSQPSFVVKVGVAAVGVLLAFLIVRRLM